MTMDDNAYEDDPLFDEMMERFYERQAEFAKQAREKTNRGNRVTRLGKQLAKERGECCELCGAKGQLHAHHIQPKSEGGSDEPSNLQMLCPECHHKAHRSTRK